MVARSAGSFLGGILNNPGAVILGGIAIALLFFSGDIRKAFAGFGESFGKVELPAITLPEINFPEIKFPDFNFPEIKIPDIFGFTLPQPDTPLTQPGTGGFNPADMPVVPTPIDVAIAGGATPQDIAEIIGIDPYDPNQDPTKFQPPITEVIEGSAPSIPIGEVAPPIAILPVPQPLPAGPQLPSGFVGGGPSFEGATIFETSPTLSSIIDEFGVTASQAANILAGINQDFGDFDFGTNTGSGIGSVIGLPQIQELIPSPNVSDAQFAGLSAEEIALQLTGGNISNF